MIQAHLPTDIAQPDAHERLVEDFCAACGFDTRLPERLISDAQGHMFEPVTLSAQAIQSPEDLAEQSVLLMRREPVGGFETLLRSNSEHSSQEALLRLHQRLAARTQNALTTRFLSDLSQLLQTVQNRLSYEANAHEEAYQKAQNALSIWQDQTKQQPGFLKNLWTLVLGEGSRLSLPQVIWYWNERERLALRVQALKAALALLGHIHDDIRQLLEQAATIRAAALRQQVLVEQRLAQTPALSAGYAPWSWRSNVATSAFQLSQQADLEGQLTRLFEQLGGLNQPGDLAAQVQQLAAQEAERLVHSQSTAQLMECEASAEPLEGIDPLLLIGRQLLDQLQQYPGWRLIATARPRTETVQITPDGEPLYRLDGLATAAYGSTHDRLGFVQVELDVATDELAVMHGDDEGFRQTLERRNVFVLEELASAWAPATSTVVANNGDLLEEVPLG